MTAPLYPVILSGGSGTRLWPLSRDLLPKQLLPLAEERSLLAATVARVAGNRFAAPIVVCNQDHRFLVREQLACAGIAPERIIVEPIARNTAPAIAAAALVAASHHEDAQILVLPSDHVIRDLPAFQDAIRIAAGAAGAGYLVTFGITPTAPETGYGYIRSGAAIGGLDGAFSIARFVEKPALATARTYLDEGDWSWNSGMFVFGAKQLLEELSRFEPDMVTCVREALDRGSSTDRFTELDKRLFGAAPAKSIDYAVMERTERAAVVPVSLGWNDVGSWSALWDIADKDEGGNFSLGDVIAIENEGCYLRSDGPLVAALGLKDIVMVATRDVVLAAPKERAQEVKSFVTELRDRGRTEATAHRVVQRPWGSYEILDSGPGFRVTRLTVAPGAGLSLRLDTEDTAEWVVAKGSARVAQDREIELKAADAVRLQTGLDNRLVNDGAGPLIVVEVRSWPGAYEPVHDPRAGDYVSA